MGVALQFVTIPFTEKLHFAEFDIFVAVVGVRITCICSNNATVGVMTMTLHCCICSMSWSQIVTTVFVTTIGVMVTDCDYCLYNNNRCHGHSLPQPGGGQWSQAD